MNPILPVPAWLLFEPDQEICDDTRRVVEQRRADREACRAAHVIGSRGAHQIARPPLCEERTYAVRAIAAFRRLEGRTHPPRHLTHRVNPSISR